MKKETWLAVMVNVLNADSSATEKKTALTVPTRTLAVSSRLNTSMLTRIEAVKVKLIEFINN